jgi:hypothetical protein
MSTGARCAARPGFALPGVANALNLELNLLRLFEVALVVASWCAVLNCSRRKPLLHCAWLVVHIGVLRIVVGGDPQTLLLRCARTQRCAWLCCARKRAVCIVVVANPRTLSPSLSVRYSNTCENSAKGTA